MSFIGANEMVFNNDTVNGIHTGGFSVNSIMMKNGISPIMTINKEQTGGSNLVSDIFNNLVVPNWTLSYDNKIGGKHKYIDNDSDEDEVIDEDLHDKLLELVKENDSKIQEKKKRATRRQTKTKKGGKTKRNK
jgi:hypothetical protein